MPVIFQASLVSPPSNSSVFYLLVPCLTFVKVPSQNMLHHQKCIYQTQATNKHHQHWNQIVFITYKQTNVKKIETTTKSLTHHHHQLLTNLLFSTFGSWWQVPSSLGFHPINFYHTIINQHPIPFHFFPPPFFSSL